MGGLVTSTALTLLVLPVIYAWAESRRAGAGGRRGTRGRHIAVLR